MIRIGFVGAPSTGKTTLAKEVQIRLTREHPESNVVFLSESYIRDSAKRERDLHGRSMVMVPEGQRARYDMECVRKHISLHSTFEEEQNRIDYFVEDAAIYNTLMYMMALCGSFIFSHRELKKEAVSLYDEVLTHASGFYDLLVYCPLLRIPIVGTGRPFAVAQYLKLLNTALLSFLPSYTIGVKPKILTLHRGYANDACLECIMDCIVEIENEKDRGNG